jgi:peptidoglycan/LPS O-acetylase OafA/YrhL
MKSRIIGLDVIRALAIILVLIWHWFPEGSNINYFFNGKLGVNLFFVLSGYLISKGLIESANQKTISQLKSFYFKRFLRIFPIYYLVLIILLLINYSYIKDVQFWYWFYGVNVLQEIDLKVVPYTIHFWSLSVEEQFYLLWPILFLFFVKKRKQIKLFFSVVILVSILFQLFESLVFKTYFLNGFIYFYSFAFGACIHFIEKKITLNQNLLILLVSTICVVIISISVQQNVIPVKLNNFGLDFTFSLFSASLLMLILNKESSFKKIKYHLTPLLYIGKISYGIYIFHYFAYPFNHFLHTISIQNNWKIPFTQTVLFPEFSNDIIRFIYFFSITLVIATISYHLIEKPIIKFSNIKMIK